MKLIEVYNDIQNKKQYSFPLNEQGDGSFAYTEDDSDYYGKRGSGVLIYCKTTGNCLLLKRSLLVNEPLTWGIVSGKLKDGENPLTSIRREISEELKVSGIDIIPNPIYVYRDKKFVFYTYLGLVETEFKPKLNWENTRYAWIPLDKFRMLKLHFGLKELLSKSNIKNMIGKYSDGN